MASTAQKLQEFQGVTQGLSSLAGAVEGVKLKKQAETARKRKIVSSRFTDAFRLAYFGNKEGALQRLNEGTKDGDGYRDISIDGETGDVSLTTHHGELGIY